MDFLAGFGGAVDTAQLLALALLQGVTEFLPISSSAHLLLPHLLLGWPDQGLAYDAVVHLGCLLAVLLWLRRDLAALAGAGWMWLRRGAASDDSRLLGCLLLASLPILPVGYFGRFFIEAELRTAWVIAAATFVFALLLLWADRRGKRTLAAGALTPGRALLIGFAQCLALIPGASRAGVTMTAALAAGFTRAAAVRIAFLLSIPAIAAAATVKLWDLASAAPPQATALAPSQAIPLAQASALDLPQTILPPQALDLALSFAVAAITAYLCLATLLRLVERVGFLPFVLYRLLLAPLLLL